MRRAFSDLTVRQQKLYKTAQDEAMASHFKRLCQPKNDIVRQAHKRNVRRLVKLSNRFNLEL